MDSFQSAKEEIRRAADIVELIGEVVQLKRAGQSYVGLCPFHSEKDPSFTVSQARQMFHCFGCKKGGDIFAFWMEYHKVPFPQAIRDLADRYHVIIPEEPVTPAQKGKMALKESLFKINETAAEYFHHILRKSTKGTPGRDYLDKRSASGEIISEFRLGYAPDEWDGLTRFLTGKGVGMENALQAGLVIPRKSGGYYDRFRGRVIFPILNLRKQVVGFGGRVLDDSLPKYVNTPETPVFRKGEVLYGLHAALKTIRESGRAVVVEGYTDVLALKRHGFHEAVATLGTALTRDHIRLLKGYAREAVVVFDADMAGKTAAMKSLSFFLDEALSSRVMVLPEGEDPDSFVNKNGLDGFSERLTGSLPMFDFFIDLKLSLGGDQIEGQVNALKEIVPVLAGLRSIAQRSLYLKRLSDKLGISESTLLAELKKWEARHSWEGEDADLRTRLSPSKAKGLNGMDDLYLLNLLINHPHSIHRLMKSDCKLLLSDSLVKEIYDAVVSMYKRGGEITASDILENLGNESARERFREAMLTPPIFSEEKLEQVLNGFEHSIDRIRMSAPLTKAREQCDLEQLNKILKFKRDRESQVI